MLSGLSCFVGGAKYSFSLRRLQWILSIAYRKLACVLFHGY